MLKEALHPNLVAQLTQLTTLDALYLPKRDKRTDDSSHVTAI